MLSKLTYNYSYVAIYITNKKFEMLNDLLAYLATISIVL